MCVEKNRFCVSRLCEDIPFEHWELVGIKVVNRSGSNVPNYVIKQG